MMRLRGLSIFWALTALVLGCIACSRTETADSGAETGTDLPKVEAPSPQAEASVPEGAGRLYDTASTQPGYCEDPGRSRCEQLFKLMYGASSAQVQKRLVPVDWFGTKVKFSSVNGAADSLRAVSREIKNNPHLLAYTKTAGTFYWRNVSGSERLSAHSYGIAIDVGVSKSNYLKWDNPGKNETATIKYKNSMPLELVRIFERHGFIWGGRWYHYDTMHFEFRPELLM